jgi:hypothetical protein
MMGYGESITLYLAWQTFDSNTYYVYGSADSNELRASSASPKHVMRSRKCWAKRKARAPNGMGTSRPSQSRQSTEGLDLRRK